MSQRSVSSLWLRVIASVILIPSALAAVYAGGWVLAVWTGAAAFAMSRELVRIVHHETGFGWRLSVHAAAIGGSQLLLALSEPRYALACILGAAIAGSALAQRAGERAIWTVAGVLFIAYPCFAFVQLRGMVPFGFETIVWLLCVVWATDSAAYLAGSVFGGPKLAPFISPNKTWVGAVAGFAAGIAVAIALTQLSGFEATTAFIACSALLSLLTQCGDLAESFLKRTFGVKDASDLIPGHGGALDRLDGLIFATTGLAIIAAANGGSPVAWALP